MSVAGPGWSNTRPEKAEQIRMAVLADLGDDERDLLAKLNEGT